MGLERLYGALPGNEAALAARNMRENRNIQQNITLLFISISAVIAISVVGDFVTSYVSDVFRGAELEGFADGTMEPEFVERVRCMDGVETVLPLHVYKDRIQAGGRTFRRVEATDNLERYVSMFALHETEKGALGRAEAVFDRERTVLLSEDCMERTGFHVGDVVALFDGAVQREYRVGGSFKSRATDVEAVISSSLQPKILGPMLTSSWLTPPPIPRRSWCRFGICSAGLRTGAGPWRNFTATRCPRWGRSCGPCTA